MTGTTCNAPATVFHTLKTAWCDLPSASTCRATREPSTGKRWRATASISRSFASAAAAIRRGGILLDDRFFENIDGASAAGLETGVYFFSQATTAAEAREEATFVLAQLGGRTLSLPIVFDHEPVSSSAGRANNVTGTDLAACEQAFRETITAAGYNTMVYGNKGDIARFPTGFLSGTPVWFAEYDVAAPTASFAFSYWQYTNGGSVAGIDTAVDLNLRLPLA